MQHPVHIQFNLGQLSFFELFGKYLFYTTIWSKIIALFHSCKKWNFLQLLFFIVFFSIVTYKKDMIGRDWNFTVTLATHFRDFLILPSKLTRERQHLNSRLRKRPDQMNISYMVGQSNLSIESRIIIIGNFLHVLSIWADFALLVWIK